MEKQQERPDYRKLPPRIRPEQMVESQPGADKPPMEPAGRFDVETRLMLLYS
ncbi:hypothetical protein [Spirilliplanes yamanashiensis]|nr:hypothetical protein [Spirilliplanes yamanashiensis]MDP9817874.1 hypothetical protein [Spirilliplanes yamanashiensis]